MRLYLSAKKLILSLLLMSLPLAAFTQNGLLHRQDLLPLVKDALSHTYNFEFEKARQSLTKLKNTLPDHPASPFLEALILYWENYPMTLENPNAGAFIRLMDQSAIKGEKMAEENEKDPEGLFFALFSRAFFAMFYSDNGKTSKVFPYLNAMYGQMLKGMKMKDEFNEFYFSSGLYNYYIEAYPEKHPVYKPAKILFRSGNKKQGLRDLEFCAENSIYLRTEARYFLALIYSGYENNMSLASEYAAELYNEFPNNTSYEGLYAETLLFIKKYHLAELVINNMSRNTDDFSRLQTHILRGYLLERHEKDFETAFEEYNKGLELTKKYGSQADHLKVLAWMGLSRYYKYKGDATESSKYYKMARNGTSYEYILNDK